MVSSSAYKPQAYNVRYNAVVNGAAISDRSLADAEAVLERSQVNLYRNT